MSEPRYARLSALELQTSMESVIEGNDELHEALREIERLRSVCIDIIDLVNCSPKSAYLQGGVSEQDSCELLDKINDVAHKYYLPICQRP